MIDNKEQQYEIFARASRLGRLTQHERNMSGVKIIKRKILGICGYEAYKTLDELANIFLELNMFEDIDEAKKFIPSLNGKDFYYGSREDVLVFDKVQDEKMEDIYRVRG